MQRRMVVIFAAASLGAGGAPPPKPKLATRFIFPVNPNQDGYNEGYEHIQYATGLRKWHAGLDVGLQGRADLGLGFKVVANGEVFLAKENGGGWGKHTKIKHFLTDGTTVCSHYAHCDRLLVREGDIVEIGQSIGTIGETGNAEGPHLHLEILTDCSANNPLFDDIAPVSKVAMYLDPRLFIADRQNVEEIPADPMLDYFGLGMVYFQVTRPVPSASLFFEVAGEAVGLAEAVSRGWVNDYIYVWHPNDENGRWITDPATEERTFDPESWYYFFVSFPTSGATINFHLPAYYLVRERAQEESIRLARNNGEYEKVDLRSFRLENFADPGWASFDRYVITLLNPKQTGWPANSTLIHATYLYEPGWRWFAVTFPDFPDYFDGWHLYETVLPY